MGLWSKFSDWLAGDDGHQDPYEAVQLNPADPVIGSLSQHLNYGAYDEETGLFALQGLKKGKYKPMGAGFVMELNPLTGANPDIVEQLGNLLTILPEHTPMQIQMFGSPDISDFLSEYQKLQASRPEDDPSREVYAELAAKRAAYWQKGSNQILVPDTVIRLRTLRCIVSINMPWVDTSNLGDINKATALHGRLRDSLKALNLYERTWTADDLLGWTEMILNPHRMFSDHTQEPKRTWDQSKFLSEQMIDGHTSVRVLENGSGLRFDNGKDSVIARCYSVNGYPDEFELAGMGAVIGNAIETNMNYPSPFLVSMSLMKPDYDATHNTIMLKAARATQTAESQLAKIMPQAHLIKRDYDICLAAYQQGGGGIVKMLHQVLIFDTPENISLSESQAVAIWQSQGFRLYRDQFLQMGSLLSALPMSMDNDVQQYLTERKRWSTKTSVNAVSMAPLIGEWHGLGKPVIGLFGKRGQAMGINLFDNPSGNYNFAVIGASGSGKSFFANDLIRSYLGVGAQIWVIDVGRSYEKFCHIVGGQYIEFTYEQNICFPPFQMVTEIEEDIELLKLIFSLMASPSDQLSEHQKAKLQRIIEEVWYEHGEAGTVDHVRDKCLSCLVTDVNGVGSVGERDYAMVAVGDQLYAYSSQGMYGRYFNGDLTVEFTSSFIVLELEELKGKPDLQQIIMQLIMYRIMQAMYFSRSHYKLMLIDEAWDLLGNNESAAKFIETGYRRVRKYLGACGTLTQGVNDYFKTSSAEAALENSDWIFHLRSNAKSLKTVEEKQPFEVNDYVMRQLRSLNKTNYYSDIFISTPLGQGVGRLYADPFTALMSSSKAEDFEAVNRYRNQGLNTAQAIAQVLADRGIH